MPAGEAIAEAVDLATSSRDSINRHRAGVRRGVQAPDEALVLLHEAERMEDEVLEAIFRKRHALPGTVAPVDSLEVVIETYDICTWRVGLGDLHALGSYSLHPDPDLHMFPLCGLQGGLVGRLFAGSRPQRHAPGLDLLVLQERQGLYQDKRPLVVLVLSFAGDLVHGLPALVSGDDHEVLLRR